MHKIRVTKKQFRILVLVYRIGGFLLVSGLLVGISVLMGKPFEFILIFAPYFVTKQLYARQYHATSLKQCLLLSLGIFSFLMVITLPSTMSLLTSLAIGILTPYLSYKCGVIQFKLKDYAYIEPRFNQLVEFYNAHTIAKPFCVDDCSVDELLARCSELGFSKENTDLAITFFVDKTKHKIIADKLCIDVKSVTMRKRRMRDKLNKN